jgi:transposase
MTQLHKRFTDEQIRLLFKRFCEGLMTRMEIEEIIGVSKTRFFALVKAYRLNPETFSITYLRAGSPKLSEQVEMEIEQELLRDKDLIEDPRLPIHEYNYSALRDRLHKKGIQVSVPTIIKRAKRIDCYKPRRKTKIHDREVVTTAIGALAQHDASLHLWSPYAQEKWTLITSIDDYSRKLLFADFFPRETSWAHIQAAQYLMKTYGIPLNYYVDNLRVFRFIHSRDSFWRKNVLQTDEIDPQWRQVMRTMGVMVTYALSPQAKGKVERPYRWLQDRIVRACALDKLSSLEDVRSILKEEIDRYNNHQVHSTTGEIPSIRFAKAKQQGNSLFRPFVLPKPYTSLKDVFCLRETRMVDGYRRISVFNKSIEVPKVPLREDVEIHLVPDLDRQSFECRIWWNQKMVQSVVYPMQGLRVHF